MKIEAQNLGFRETCRLCSFIQLLIEDRPNDCIDSEFGYDLRYDEPYILINPFTQLYATDYDIAFTSDNIASYVLPLDCVE